MKSHTICCVCLKSVEKGQTNQPGVCGRDVCGWAQQAGYQGRLPGEDKTIIECHTFLSVENEMTACIHG